MIAVPWQQKIKWLNAVVEGHGPDRTEILVHLYKTNYAPTGVTIIQQMHAIEVDLPFYQPQTAVSEYTASQFEVFSAQRKWPTVQWDVGDGAGLPLTVWGFFVTNPEDDELWWSELRPEGPVELVNTGQVFAIWPTLTLKDIIA